MIWPNASKSSAKFSRVVFLFCNPFVFQYVNSLYVDPRKCESLMLAQAVHQEYLVHWQGAVGSDGHLSCYEFSGSGHQKTHIEVDCMELQCNVCLGFSLHPQFFAVGLHGPKLNKGLDLDVQVVLDVQLVLLEADRSPPR